MSKSNRSLRPIVYAGLALSASLTVATVAAVNVMEHSEAELNTVALSSVVALASSTAMAGYATVKKRY